MEELNAKTITKVHRDREIERAQSRIRFTLTEYSENEIADKLGITVQTIRNWEAGTNPMSATKAAKVVELNGEIQARRATRSKQKEIETREGNGHVEGEFDALVEMAQELLPHEKLKMARVLILQAMESYS